MTLEPLLKLVVDLQRHTPVAVLGGAEGFVTCMDLTNWPTAISVLSRNRLEQATGAGAKLNLADVTEGTAEYGLISERCRRGRASTTGVAYLSRRIMALHYPT